MPEKLKPNLYTKIGAFLDTYINTIKKVSRFSRVHAYLAKLVAIVAFCIVRTAILRVLWTLQKAQQMVGFSRMSWDSRTGQSYLSKRLKTNLNASVLAIKEKPE